jgi:WD40 repeat protein
MLQINTNQVATTSADNTVRIWNVNPSTELVNTYNAHTISSNCLAVLPNGLLASGGSDNTVRVWNMLAQTVKTLNVANQVNTLKMNTIKGNLVVNMVNEILIYNPTTLILNQTISTSRTYFDMDILLPSGNLIMAGSYLDLYTLPSGILEFSYLNSSAFVKVKLLPDNVTCVAGRADGLLMLFNSNTSSLGLQFRIHSSTIGIISLTPDLLYVISGAYGGLLALWQWTTMNLIQVSSFIVTGPVETGVILASAYTESELNLKKL